MSVYVAPHGGAWIEICRQCSPAAAELVAPHGGAWIEIPASTAGGWKPSSPLTEGRGLKSAFRRLQRY